MKRILSISALLLLAACGGKEEAEVPAVDKEVAPAPVQGPYPFEGLWANSFTDCSLEPGSAEEAPILITAERTVGYENECEVTAVAVLDEVAQRYELARSCMAEGERYEEVIELRVRDNTLMMQSDAGSVTWLKCPADGESE